MSLRVLVLGAGGFIGSHVVQALAASDWATPIAAVRRAMPAGAESIDRVQLDARDREALRRVLARTDAVVDCIAGGPEMITRCAAALQQAAAATQGTPRVVCLSSMAVYGAATGVVDETAAQRGSDPYARAKRTAEAQWAGYGPVVILRPGIVYGPRSRQWTERIGRWLRAHRLGDLGAVGDGCCNLLYVDDLVAAISQALRLPRPDGQVFNLAMSAPPSWNEYLVRFARALGAVPVSHIGSRQLLIETRLLAPPLKIAELVLRRARLPAGWLPEPIPPSLLRLCAQDLRLEVGRAEQELALRWTGLEEGVSRAANWFLQASH